MTVLPVSVEPEITLESWALIMHRDGHIHITGKRFVPEDDREKGRITSKLESFDLDTMTGTTNSGRVYHLVGSPNEVYGEVLAVAIWGDYHAQGLKIVSPEDVELALSSPPSPFRH